MLAKDLISDIVPAISTRETGLKALNWMEIFRISHLPVVDDNYDFLGLISDTEIFDYDLAEKRIGAHNLTLLRPFVYADVHVYEVIGAVSKQKLTIVPVLDKHNKYIGVISLHDLVHHFAEFTAADNPGVVFVLEMGLHDYSLSQISQIIESNDAKVLSLYISSLPESTKIEVTIKLNTIDFAPVRQTFERYGYTIKAAYTDNDEMQSLLEERYDELIHFLSI